MAVALLLCECVGVCVLVWCGGADQIGYFFSPHENLLLLATVQFRVRSVQVVLSQVSPFSRLEGQNLNKILILDPAHVRHAVRHAVHLGAYLWCSYLSRS